MDDSRFLLTIGSAKSSVVLHAGSIGVLLRFPLPSPHWNRRPRPPGTPPSPLHSTESLQVLRGHILVAFVYGVWLWWDWDSPTRRGYPSRWWKSFRLHQCFAEYFPIIFHATADLPSDKNYLIGVHPHGIVCASAFGFLSRGSGSDVFPNIDFRLCTLAANFSMPLFREVLMLMGFIDCSKKSLSATLVSRPSGSGDWRNVLGGRKKGQATVLVVGGAEEALDSHPGKNILTLRSRKGFCEVALETGASLVPSYAFGENEIYIQASNKKGAEREMMRGVQGTAVRAVQTRFKEITGCSAPLYHGRGMFNRSFGFVPFKKELNTVLGAPIAVEKCEHPTKEQVDSLHHLYIEKLTELFDENKIKFGLDKDDKLVIY